MNHSPVFRFNCSVCENMLYNIFFALHFSPIYINFAGAKEDKGNGEDRPPTALAAVSRKQSWNPRGCFFYLS